METASSQCRVCELHVQFCGVLYLFHVREVYIDDLFTVFDMLWQISDVVTKLCISDCRITWLTC